MRRSSQVRVGIAGWSYPDWAGIVYPARSSFQKLKFLAKLFNTIEINTTFYRIPEADQGRRWCDSVADREEFEFTVKLLQDFTHGREGETLREQDFAALSRKFKELLQVMQAQKRLGALLIQFPYGFHWTPQNRERLTRLLREFNEFPLVVEVRHRSFQDGAFFDFLRKEKIGFVNLDQPRVSQSLEPTTEVTAPVAYVRFHGRNARSWFDPGAGRDQRYDYLYSHEELEEWRGRIDSISKASDIVYVIFNNHFRGQEVVNALEFSSIWQDKAVAIPAALKKVYPRLESIAAPQDVSLEDAQLPLLDFPKT
ncbi:MAG: DUF72 domain-containing protein [Acidobacteriia bacterium]|nr:DUF72 domain-containing protein [Terriglobia bacterium]